MKLLFAFSRHPYFNPLENYPAASKLVPTSTISIENDVPVLYDYHFGNIEIKRRSFGLSKDNFITYYYLIYFLRNVYFSWWSYELQDGRRARATIYTTNGSVHYTQLGCLSTNCSTFGVQETEDGLPMRQDDVAAQLLMLPLFRICHPRLSFLYPPATDMGKLALLLFPASNTFVLIYCIMLPIWQTIFKSSSDSVLFIMAPRLSRRLTMLRMRGSIKELNSPSLMKGSVYLPGEKHSSAKFFPEPLFITRASLTPLLPAIRTEWWRKSIVRAYFYSFVYLLIGALVGPVIFIILINEKKSDTRELMNRYQKYTGVHNCSILVQDRGEEAPLLMQDINLDWQLAHSVEHFILGFLNVTGLTALLIYYYLNIGELTCWLRELEHNTLILVELTSLLKCSRDTTFPGRPQTRMTPVPARTLAEMITYSISNFIMRTEFMFGAILRTRMLPGPSNTTLGPKLSNKISYQQLATDMIKIAVGGKGRSAVAHNASEGQLASIVCGQMEYLNVSYKLFLESIRAVSRSIESLLVASNLLIYGLILSGIFYAGVKASTSVFMINYILMCMCCATMYIYLAARFWSSVSR